jgi:hypothetical protein
MMAGQDIVHSPVVHHHGWPTVSLPFPPPPPLNQHAPQIDHVTSPIQSSHARKRLKTTIHEPMSSKGKKKSLIPNHLITPLSQFTSHAQQINEPSPSLSEVQPHASNQPLTDKAHSTNKARRSTSSEKRQIASHSKYGF